MKSKKGVTLIMLVIIVVIMTTLVTVTVINGTDAYNSAKITKLSAEISQIEMLINNYIIRNSEMPFQTINLDISSYSEEEKQQFEGEDISEDVIQMYIVDLDAIDAEELSYGTGKNGEKDRYIYSSVTKRVYYEQGNKIGDVIYHRVDK